MRLNREEISSNHDNTAEQEVYSSQYPSEVFSYYKKATANEVFNAAISALIHQKALDLKALDITASDIADTFIIVSGTSQRHVRGIADKVKEKLLKLGERTVNISGYEEGDWIVLDYADLIIHIFYEPMRQYYALDEMWSKKGVEIYPDPELAKEIRKLRTGISW